MSPPSVPVQAFRFARGLRSFLRDPVTVVEAHAAIREGIADRAERLLGVLTTNVWPVPSSPHRALLHNAGLEPGDVEHLVRERGVEGALDRLRDAGVYVAYEEYMGTQVAARGSQTFEFSPPDFANSRVRPDYMATSGGTRSRGTASGSSFRDQRRKAGDALLVYDAFGVVDTPAAMWMPALPGNAGLSTVLQRVATSGPPERWWSPIDPGAPGIARRKQAANLLLPLLARAYGARIPRPRYVSTSDPGVVVDWCGDALARCGRAVLHAYPSSAVAVAQAAVELEVPLEGLLIRSGGEPLTPSRRKLIEASGATTCQIYAFAPAGYVAMACPRCQGDEMHLLDHALAVTTRRRQRPDGVEVDALLWTSLAATAGQILLNTENDDYGTVTVPERRCGCSFEDLGLVRKISGVRGMSKVVAGGITIDGEALQHLVDSVLPRRFGGSPADYQFVESGEGGVARLDLRVSPRLGAISEVEALDAVRAALREHELGILALAVWSPAGVLRVVREDPVTARSGKTLAFVPLSRG